MESSKANAVPFQIEEPKAAVGQTASSVEALTGKKTSSDSDWSLYRYCVTTIDVINHVLIVTLTVFLLHYFLQDYGVTNLHAALCTVGYILLMSEAILVLATGNLLTSWLSRRGQSHVHWILQALGLICTLVGVVIMYRAKKIHFKSIHAITGIASVVPMCVLAVLGYPVLIAAKLRKFVRPVVIKFAHNFIGIACFVVGMVSQIYGYKMGWLERITHVENVQPICITLTILITVFSVRGAVCSLCRQAAALFK